MNHQQAHEELAEAVADIRHTSLRVDGNLWSQIGTPDLTTALELMQRTTDPAEYEAIAHRVSEAFIIEPGQLYAHGLDNLSFGTAILSLRLALAHLDATQRV
ncbi:hypothetical protein ACLQ2N_32795 [Streptomyces sp. DT224]|uniref:hypothetical protein n=1 Tax=Streptomyces sp. DT224 TaxID=3393426 RepID=UPI003CF3A7B3